MVKQKIKDEKPKKKPKYNMWQNSCYMIKTAWNNGEKKVILLGLLSALLAVLQNLVNLYVSPMIISVLERRGSVAELMLTIAFFAAALMLVSAAYAYVEENVLFGRITVRTLIINQINKKAATTSYPNIYSEDFSNLLNKAMHYTTSNAEATEAVWGTLTDITKNVVGFAIYIALLSTVQPILFVLVILTTGVSYLLGKRINLRGYRYRDEEEKIHKRVVYLTQVAKRNDGAKDIRLFSLAPWLKELYAKATETYTRFKNKEEGVYVWAAIADLALTFLRNAAAYAYLIGAVLSGNIGIAEFLLYFTAVSGFTAWVTGILDGLTTLHKQSLDISVVRETLDYPEPFKFDGGEKLVPEKDTEYEIRLENVTFRYPGADKNTLSGIDLTLHAHEKLAVVGLNGAGKSTLVKLICGFLDPTEGRILLNGKDIREYDRADYYKLFSAVFQDFSVFAGTIAANVAQSEDDIDYDRVRECLEKASLTEKIDSLPDGVQTKLFRDVYEDAVQMSGGETQRLMLARALYKDAPIIILDEPTAALDPIAESEMYKKYDEITSGKPSVYISHRLASTRFCDRIIMIDGEKICEAGTHEELLKLGGKYAELFEVQSKYYREDGDKDEQKEDVMA